MERDAEVTRVVQIFKSGDVAYQRAFIAACPPSRFKDAALEMIHPYSRLDTILTGISILAETYCAGIDCAQGITLSKAAYLLSQGAFEAHPAITHLLNAGRSTTNCAVGLNAVGEHTALIALVQEAVQWLEDALKQLGSKGSLDAGTWNEINELIGHDILRLLRHQIEAHIELSQFDKAEAILHRAKQLFQANRGAEHYLLDNLEQRLKDIARLSVTELPHEAPSNYSPIIKDMLYGQLKAFESLTDSAPPEYRALITLFVNGMKPQIDKEIPESMSQTEALEWFARQQAPKQIPPYLRGIFEQYPQLNLSQTQSTSDLFTDFISGEITGKSSEEAEDSKT